MCRVLLLPGTQALTVTRLLAGGQLVTAGGQLLHLGHQLPSHSCRLLAHSCGGQLLVPQLCVQLGESAVAAPGVVVSPQLEL